MSYCAIRVKGLGKQYRLGKPALYRTLRDTLTDATAAPLRWMRSAVGDGAGGAPDTHGLFWALRDVSFDVPSGTVVGVIGRNGAGKSTLLKILSRITEPAEGRVEIRGRVGSLLEVGTGFHPELTGRENVFLNGAILGMRRSEIVRVFDEIVSFAEVESFIDTPVKRYSSGMYLRLAFAVAAHLEPEILIVDEVLAVGDVQFQKRCLGKIGSVARSGRTVLFVSHNMAAVRTLCSRVLLLEHGHLVADTTDLSSAIGSYTGLTNAGMLWQREPETLAPDHQLAFSSLEYRLLGSQPDYVLELRGELKSARAHPDAFLAFDIIDPASVPIMQALPRPEPFIPYSTTPQQFRVSITLPPLVPGTYGVDAWVGSHYSRTLDVVRGALAFTIPDSPTVGRSFPHSPDHGSVVPHSSVTLERPVSPCVS
jgi:lipopolysaccharide transport system ATP-binding protein